MTRRMATATARIKYKCFQSTDDFTDKHTLLVDSLLCYSHFKSLVIELVHIFGEVGQIEFISFHRFGDID